MHENVLRSSLMKLYTISSFYDKECCQNNWNLQIMRRIVTFNGFTPVAIGNYNVTVQMGLNLSYVGTGTQMC